MLAPLDYAGDLPGRKNVVWLTQVCPLLAGLLPRFLSRANIAIYRRSFDLRDLQLVNIHLDRRADGGFQLLSAADMVDMRVRDDRCLHA